MSESKHDVSIRGDLLKSLNYIATGLECDKSIAVAKAISHLELLLKNVIKGRKIIILHDDGYMEQIVIK
jgi:hypothetical protein